ncbi:EAL domain-containing protein, partial [Campylobacter jejuni]
LRVAVNMSARQLDDKGVVSEFMRAVNDAGLDPCLLDIELTESCLIEDEVAAIELMKQFRQLGVKVALDDFGTGYSSLGYLRTFEFDKIKIDKSFTQDVESSKEALAIIRAIN